MSLFKPSVKENQPATIKQAGKAQTFFQPKLTVNEPGDVYEQQADAMADRVMRMPAPVDAFFSTAQNALQRKCAHCEEEEKQVQRKETNKQQTSAGTGLEDYVSSIGNSGQNLPAESKQFFEPRFGYDFSNVKIHTGEAAAKSAQSVNALAYTTGNNIVFDSGRYAPQTDAGKKLLAHELTHVVQQGGDGVIRRYGHDNYCDETKYLKPFIWPGHAAAVSMLKNVITAFDAGDPRLTTLIPVFFGTDGLAHKAEIKERYEAINKKVNGQYLYHCNDSSNSNSDALKCKGQRAETEIHGWSPSYDITLCFDVINSGWSATDVGALIVHENYHRAFGESNHPWAVSGNPPDCSNNAVASSSKLLLDNPDSFSCMARIFL